MQTAVEVAFEHLYMTRILYNLYFENISINITWHSNSSIDSSGTGTCAQA